MSTQKILTAHLGRFKHSPRRGLHRFNTHFRPRLYTPESWKALWQEISDLCDQEGRPPLDVVPMYIEGQTVFTVNIANTNQTYAQVSVWPWEGETP